MAAKRGQLQRNRDFVKCVYGVARCDNNGYSYVDQDSNKIMKQQADGWLSTYCFQHTETLSHGDPELAFYRVDCI